MASGTPEAHVKAVREHLSDNLGVAKEADVEAVRANVERAEEGLDKHVKALRWLPAVALTVILTFSWKSFDAWVGLTHNGPAAVEYLPLLRNGLLLIGLCYLGVQAYASAEGRAFAVVRLALNELPKGLPLAGSTESATGEALGGPGADLEVSREAARGFRSGNLGERSVNGRSSGFRRDR